MIVVAKVVVPVPVTGPVSVMVWSPVFAPEVVPEMLVPVTVPVEATEVGVMFPKPITMDGAIVELNTTATIPSAGLTDVEVTVPTLDV